MEQNEPNRTPSHHEVEAETARGIFEMVRPGGMFARALDNMGRIVDGIERIGREVARGVDALERIADVVQVGGIAGVMTSVLHPRQEDVARALASARSMDAPPIGATRDAPDAPPIERKTVPPAAP